MKNPWRFGIPVVRDLEQRVLPRSEGWTDKAVQIYASTNVVSKAVFNTADNDVVKGLGLPGRPVIGAGSAAP